MSRNIYVFFIECNSVFKNQVGIQHLKQIFKIYSSSLTSEFAEKKIQESEYIPMLYKTFYVYLKDQIQSKLNPILVYLMKSVLNFDVPSLEHDKEIENALKNKNLKDDEDFKIKIQQFLQSLQSY